MAYRQERVGTATNWLSRIDAAIKREDGWRRKGKKVLARYRDERGRSGDTSKVNILWANTEVLKSSLIARMPKPDVRRRFPDAAKQNSASRLAAETIERSIQYVVDVERVEDSISGAVDDQLLPGRGVCWISYEPEIEEGLTDETNGTGDATGLGRDQQSGSVGNGLLDRSGGYAGDATDTTGEQFYGVESGENAPDAQGRIVSQTLCVDYVYWEDYCQGVARQDRDVPWKARRHVMRSGEFDAKFPDAKSSSLSTYELKDAQDEGGDESDTDQATKGFVEVWEVWDKSGGRKRIYVGRGYPDILQSDDDPYHLQSFFPTPRPLYSITTTDKMEPIPEFLQYQDQALELDRITTRIMRLLEQLKNRGIYDAASDTKGILATLPNADDGEFLPYEGWQALKEKGGIENAVGFWPMQQIIEVIDRLYLQRNQLIQQIYEITGISDIIRGTTDPRETKGAQTLKAQFGSMRMQKRQRDVQRFIRDLYALLGEMIAEHFTQETLADITQIDIPTRDEQLQARLQLQAQPQPPMPMPMGPAAMQAAPASPSAMAGTPPPAGVPALPAPPTQMHGAALNPGVAGGGPPDLPTMAQPNAPANLPYGFTSGTPIPRGALPTINAPPPKVPPETDKILRSPAWEDVIDILRSDKVRSYRIDIETDSTILQDAEAEKTSRLEFMQAFEKMLQAAYLAAVQAPMMLPLIKESFMFGIRSFKVGRSLEQAVEDAFDELTNSPPPAPPGQPQKPTGPDPQVEQGKLQLAALTAQLNHQAAMAQTAQKQSATQIDAQLQAQESQRKQSESTQAALIEMRRLAAEVQIEREKIAAMLAGKQMQAQAQAMSRSQRAAASRNGGSQGQSA